MEYTMLYVPSGCVTAKVKYQKVRRMLVRLFDFTLPREIGELLSEGKGVPSVLYVVLTPSSKLPRYLGPLVSQYTLKIVE